MNLHDIVRGAISSVHPDTSVTVLPSAGWTVNDSFRQEPAWRPAVAVQAQSQPVPDKALQFLIQERENSIWRDFYLYDLVRGLERASELGGAMLYWNGYEWQVDQVLEDWSEGAGWCKARAVQIRRCASPEEGATEPPAGTDIPAGEGGEPEGAA